MHNVLDTNKKKREKRKIIALTSNMEETECDFQIYMRIDCKLHNIDCFVLFLV